MSPPHSPHINHTGGDMSSKRERDQEAFDKVVAHLLRQGKASRNSLGQCAYRGEGGTSCAVGCLITDEEYRPDMEGEAVVSLLLRGEISLPSLRGIDAGLLRSLQITHDNVPVEKWPYYLRQVALQFHLEYRGGDRG